MLILWLEMTQQWWCPTSNNCLFHVRVLRFVFSLIFLRFYIMQLMRLLPFPSFANYTAEILSWGWYNLSTAVINQQMTSWSSTFKKLFEKFSVVCTFCKSGPLVWTHLAALVCLIKPILNVNYWKGSADLAETVLVFNANCFEFSKVPLSII